jgi:hypothetical protein
MTVYVHECSCGNLHPIEWDPHAGCDGSYVFKCINEGEVQIGGCLGERPQGARRVVAYMRIEA